MKRRTKITLVVILSLVLVLVAIISIRTSQPSTHLGIEVWSQNSPYGENAEFKVNWRNTFFEPRTWNGLTNCWLYDLDAVRVITPENETYYLEKDFHFNDYTGEVTQRWVVFTGGGLPSTGEYVFEFIKNEETVITKSTYYVQRKISWPTNVVWERRGDDLYVEWTPPEGVDESMWYKVIVKPEGETQGEKLDPEFNWDSHSAVLEDIPLIDGGAYKLKVALFFDDGYSYSEFVYFNW